MVECGIVQQGYPKYAMPVHIKYVKTCSARTAVEREWTLFGEFLAIILVLHTMCNATFPKAVRELYGLFCFFVCKQMKRVKYAEWQIVICTPGTMRFTKPELPEGPTGQKG